VHELISNRGASARIRTARRARNAEVSGDESGRGASRSLMDTLIPFTCQTPPAHGAELHKSRSARVNSPNDLRITVSLRYLNAIATVLA
jgi:hypothetical protein